jgi:hypothetical protein
MTKQQNPQSNQLKLKLKQTQFLNINQPNIYMEFLWNR